MNAAHIHLIINHVPVVGIPIALFFLAYGLWVRNSAYQRTALGVFIAIAVVTIPVFLTGEPAEEMIENAPGINEAIVETHEDSGKVSLILTLFSGGIAAIAFWFQKKENTGRLMNYGVFATAAVAFISLIYTANLGGKIRHPEIRSGASLQMGEQTGGAGEAEKESDEDDD